MISNMISSEILTAGYLSQNKRKRRILFIATDKAWWTHALTPCKIKIKNGQDRGCIIIIFPFSPNHILIKEGHISLQLYLTIFIMLLSIYSFIRSLFVNIKIIIYQLETVIPRKHEIEYLKLCRSILNYRVYLVYKRQCECQSGKRYGISLRIKLNQNFRIGIFWRG